MVLIGTEKNQTFRIGSKISPEAAFTKTIPTNGPVHEKDTNTRVGHKENSNVTSLIHGLSDLLARIGECKFKNKNDTFKIKKKTMKPVKIHY